MQFGRPPKEAPSINIAPLVDVIFLLVIFFAVSTTFLDNAGLRLELPTSSSTAPQEPKEITVLLAADGSLSFEGEVVTREQLAARLEQALRQTERKIVVLRADTGSSHGEVVRIMDLIRSAGAEALTIGARAAAGE
jgi:biopolymer transport protein ExbD